jgi:protein-L-isoaspartate(D-aspartate) O-methyltransferase
LEEIISMESFEEQRKRLVEALEEKRYIRTKAVKQAMLKVRREDFVPEEYKREAYSDVPLPIPGDVTISAPHS